MLKLSHISKIYHNKHNDFKALDDVSLTIEADHGLIFLIGPSGSGKSTLLNIIAGEDKDYDGTVEVTGKVVYAHQEVILFESMSVLDNLLLINKDRRLIDVLLRSLKLYDQRKQKVYRLSSGQKKRVEFIKAYLLAPDILLTDELTSALDEENAKAIMDAIKVLAKTTLIIAVTHDEALAETYGDKIIRLKDKKIDENKIALDKKRYQKTLKVPRRSLKDHLSLIIKDLRSRLGHTFLFGLTIVLAICSIYTAISLFGNVDTAQTYKNAFRYGQNVIINDVIITDRNHAYHIFSDDQYTTKGDYFYPEIIDEFIRSRDDIIAIQATIDHRKGRTSLDNLYDSLSYLNYLTPNGHPLNITPLEKPFIYLDDISDKKIFVKTKDEETGQEYENFEGYRLIDGSSDTYVYDISNFDLYYLIDKGADLYLSYGSMPQSTDEIVINERLATYYAEKVGIDDPSDLIGKQFYFRQFADQNYTSLTAEAIASLKDLYPDFDEEIYCAEFSYTISGISSLDTLGRMCAYSIEGYYDNKITDLYSGIHYTDLEEAMSSMNMMMPQDEFLKLLSTYDTYFSSLSFIMAPDADIEKAREELEKTIQPEFDTFIIAGDLLDTSYISFHNISSYLPLIGAVLIVVGLLPFMIAILERKREKKEKLLSKDYGYDVNALYLLKFFIDLISSYIIALGLVYLSSILFDELFYFDALFLFIVTIITNAVLTILRRLLII